MPTGTRSFTVSSFLLMCHVDVHFKLLVARRSFTTRQKEKRGLVAVFECSLRDSILHLVEDNLNIVTPHDRSFELLVKLQVRRSDS